MTKSVSAFPDAPVRPEGPAKPWRNVLIPLDGSELSTCALDRARKLLELPGVSITLLRVIESAPDRADDLRYQSDTRHREAGDALAKIRHGFLDRSIAAGAEIRFGDPATEILREIAGGNPDLVLLSTFGRPGLGRSLLGTVVQQVLRSSPAPLLLFRPRPGMDVTFQGPERLEGTRFRRLLVALDGSEAAEEIIPAAESMARTFGATIHLYRAVSGGSKEASERRGAEEYLEQWKSRLLSRGIPSEAGVRTGDAAVSALAVIRERGIDSVALTTHARRGVARSVCGSVAEEIVRGADVPILTLCPLERRLPMPARAPEQRHIRIE